jgi:hypothetical protein
MPGQAHQEDGNALCLSQTRELAHYPSRVAPVEVLARVGHQAELIGDG